MEENRLKAMPENYDRHLFLSIYESTKALRRKLASEIDPRRFGVDYQEILSWFDVKFIHTFCKYHDQKTPDLLKAYIINSLQFFRQRILRFSYSQKAQLHNTVDIEDSGLALVEDESPVKDTQILLNLSLSLIQSRISPIAYKVLLIELNPPMFILVRMVAKGKNSNTKIPSKLIAEYLGWEVKEGIKKVNACREEIRNGILEAHNYFQAKEQLI